MRPGPNNRSCGTLPWPTMGIDGERLAEDHADRPGTRPDRPARPGPHRRGGGGDARHQRTLGDEHPPQPHGPARCGEPVPARPRPRVPAQGTRTRPPARPERNLMTRRTIKATVPAPAMLLAGGFGLWGATAAPADEIP